MAVAAGEQEKAVKEKSSVALTSVLAAVGLTLFKIVVGVLSGSLGILAEAAHSALDLVAASVTYLAVRFSGRPADENHRYGHGKIENLSALFEVLLLLGTCVWIIREALNRLMSDSVHIEVSAWAFLVMGVSIVVDINRSGKLFRAAKKHNSQALEADALHFSSDIWSSAVVIAGLVCVLVGTQFPQLAFLLKADAVAALAVAGIVILISIELGKRTVNGLLDTAPQGAAEKIKAAVEGIPGVVDCHKIRVRPSGPAMFVDTHVMIDGSWTLERAHELTERVEGTIQAIIPDADVTVHPEPVVLEA